MTITRYSTALAKTLLVLTLSLTAATALSQNRSRPKLGNDESTFVFAGRCFNGATYRLLAYQQNVDGEDKPFYDYAGPAGAGTIQTAVAPKVMVARVCRAQAEITAMFQ